MTARKDDNLLGRLALHFKLLTRDQLVEALQQQEREGHRRKIGEIFIERGWMTPERFQQLLRAQRDYHAKVASQQPAPAGPTAPGAEPPSPPARAAGAPGSAAPAAAPATETASPPGTALPPLQEGSADPALVAPADGGALPPLARATAAVAAASPASRAAAPSAEPRPREAAAPAPAPAAVATAPPAPAPRPLVAPTGRSIAELLTLAVERRASDLHVHAGQPVRLRIDGDFQPLADLVLAPADTERLLRELLDEAQAEQLTSQGQVDFAYTLPGVGRFRSNVYRQQHGTDGVFRVIPAEPPTLSELGLPLDLARLANYHQGLVLITGPTGCGKSSTLAALIRIVNEERRDHIITVEDPIEFVHRPLRCVVNQRQVGSHTGSFSRALRAALREDPDVIVVGELRDLETISLALTAAETGHLVLATLHTMNAINTINRLVGVFPPSQQSQIRTMVSESLRAITSQRLVRRAEGAGRVPALEILMANKAVGNLIRESKTFQIRSVLQTGASHGMRSLDASLEQLVREGVVTAEEARRHAEDPRKIPG